MSRVALAWCALYTCAVPPEVRERRREELASHLWDAAQAGRTGTQILVGSLRGAVDDLRWCADERRLAHLPPLVFGANGSTAVAGSLIVLTYLLSAIEVSEPVYETVAVTSAAVIAVSIADRVVRWLPRRNRP